MALDPGTYYVKETTTGAWYTNYTVDYTAAVEGRDDVAKTWLPEAGGAVQVTVASADTEERRYGVLHQRGLPGGPRLQ